MSVFPGISGIGVLETCGACTHQTRGESNMTKRHRILSFLVCIALVTALVKNDLIVK